METSIDQVEKVASKTPFVTPEELLNHWQGHRRVTRRIIEAFPEDKLFNYSLGGMRPFSELAMEMVNMADPGMTGVVTRKWETPAHMRHIEMPKTKKELLRRWDEVTDYINANWPLIPEGRFQEVDKAFGMWEGTMAWIILYFVDNEIHHRGQGYVYLRSLGIEPPPFWDRA
jgi:uncharacterized damage-inducible protein DinB